MWDRELEAQSRNVDELPGVIETIGVAFTRLLARPWIVLGPILLDLYLWLGLKVTASPLFLQLADFVRPVELVGDSSAQILEDQASYNLAELLSFQLFTIRMPTFLPSLVTDESIRVDGWSPELSGGPWWLLAVLAPLLLAAGYLIGSAFLIAVGDVARDRQMHFDFHETVTAGYRLVLWILASAGLMTLISWPLIVAQGAFLYFGSGTMDLLLFLMFIPIGVGFVLFFFSAYAIVLDGATAAQALRSSYRVVRAYGWQSLAFIVSFMIVTGGFPYFWRLLATVAPGTMIAIVGHAFVSTGMIAAGMIYYEDRAAVVDLGEAVEAPATA